MVSIGNIFYSNLKNNLIKSLGITVLCFYNGFAFNAIQESEIYEEKFIEENYKILFSNSKQKQCDTVDEKPFNVSLLKELFDNPYYGDLLKIHTESFSYQIIKKQIELGMKLDWRYNDKTFNKALAQYHTIAFDSNCCFKGIYSEKDIQEAVEINAAFLKVTVAYTYYIEILHSLVRAGHEEYLEIIARERFGEHFFSMIATMFKKHVVSQSQKKIRQRILENNYNQSLLKIIELCENSLFLEAKKYLYLIEPKDSSDSSRVKIFEVIKKHVENSGFENFEEDPFFQHLKTKLQNNEISERDFIFICSSTLYNRYTFLHDSLRELNIKKPIPLIKNILYSVMDKIKNTTFVAEYLSFLSEDNDSEDIRYAYHALFAPSGIPKFYSFVFPSEYDFSWLATIGKKKNTRARVLLCKIINLPNTNQELKQKAWDAIMQSLSDPSNVEKYLDFAQKVFDVLSEINESR